VQSPGMIHYLWTPGRFSKELVFLVKDLASLSDRLWLSPLFHEGAQNFKPIYLSILSPSGLQLQVKTGTGRRFRQGIRIAWRRRTGSFHEFSLFLRTRQYKPRVASRGIERKMRKKG
jgi:hypothetical protein